MELSKPLCFSIGEGADEFVRHQVDPQGTENTHCFCYRGQLLALTNWCECPNVLLVSENHFAGFVSQVLEELPSPLSRFIRKQYNWPDTKSGQADNNEFNQIVQPDVTQVTIALSSFDGSLEFASTQRLCLILEILLYAFPCLASLEIAYCHRTIPEVNSLLATRLRKLTEKSKVQLKFTCYTSSYVQVELPNISYLELEIIYSGVAACGPTVVQIPQIPKTLKKLVLRDNTLDSGGYVAVSNWHDASRHADSLEDVELHLCVIWQSPMRNMFDALLPRSSESLSLTLCGREGFFTSTDIPDYSISSDNGADTVYIGAIAVNYERIQYFRMLLDQNRQLRTLVLNNVTFEAICNLFVRIELERETLLMVPSNIERLTITNWVMNLEHWRFILKAFSNLRYLTLSLRDKNMYDFVYLASDLSLCPSLQNVYFISLNGDGEDNHGEHRDTYFFYAYLHEINYWEAIDIKPDPSARLWSFEFAQYRSDILSGVRARGPTIPLDPNLWSTDALNYACLRRHHFLLETYRVSLPFTTDIRLFEKDSISRTETRKWVPQFPAEPAIAAHLPSPASSTP